MAHLFIFGLGYTATRFAQAAKERGFTISATGRAGDIALEDADAVAQALGRADHVLSSVPPADDSDPVLDRYGELLDGKWLAYLSSTGV